MKLKKVLIFSIPVVLIFLYIAFQYGSVGSVMNITGCYSIKHEFLVDKVCLDKSGKYQQITMSGSSLEQYNESDWRSFSYVNDEGNFVAATLNGFVVKNTNGSKKVIDLDIQPYKSMWGKVLFVIGSASGPGGQKFYVRE